MAANESRADRLLMLEDKCDFTHKNLPHPSSATNSIDCLVIESPLDIEQMETTGIAVLCEIGDVTGVEHEANITITERDGSAIAEADQVEYTVKGIKNDGTGFVMLKLEEQ